MSKLMLQSKSFKVIQINLLNLGLKKTMIRNKKNRPKTNCRFKLLLYVKYLWIKKILLEVNYRWWRNVPIHSSVPATIPVKASFLQAVREKAKDP